MTPIKDGSGAEEVDQTGTQPGETGTYSTDEEALDNFDEYRLKETKKKATKEEEDEEEEDSTPPKKEEEEDSTQPLQGKDARHANKKINEEIQKKTILAEKLIDKDPEAIYEIAESDPRLAEHILKKHSEYGASTVKELLELRDMNDADLSRIKKSTVQTNEEIDKIRKKLVDSEVRRLRENDNPDLDGELEDTFREMVQHPDYENLDSERILGMARAFLGKESPKKKSKANDVAEDMLGAAQGAMPSSGTGGKLSEGKSDLTPSMKKMMRAMGLSEETYLKYQKQGKV